MVVFHFNDDPGQLGEGKADLVVTDYQIGDYCGSGDALVLRGGMVENWGLSHCSCYGPGDDGPCDKYTVGEFMDQQSSVTASWPDKLASKFIELMKELPR